MQYIIKVYGDLIPLERYQRLEQLPKTHLSKNFLVGEFSCRGQLLLAEHLINFLQMYRASKGSAVTINSGYRTLEKQNELKARGYKVAKTSPHIEGMAADIKVINKADCISQLSILKEVAKTGNYKIRLGYKQYNYGFIHLDVCPMYYGKDRPLHKVTHPKVWENEIEW